MNHQDHVRLLRKGITTHGGVWADFGSGDGAYTLALRELLGPETEIYSIDRDSSRLQRQRELFNEMFPDSVVKYLEADFSLHIPLPSLDGIVMANSLHFFRDKKSILTPLLRHLKPGGTFLLVEYNTDVGNLWVPYPLSYRTFVQLCPASGLTSPEFLDSIPSHFLVEIYAAKTGKNVSGVIAGA